jgi:hypothetical protein
MSVSELLVNAKSWSNIHVKEINATNLNVNEINATEINATNINLSNQPAYSYTGNGTQPAISVQTIIINLPTIDVLFNVGGFSYSSGVITIPESGFYYINLQLNVQNNSVSNTTIYTWAQKNSNALRFCYVTTKSDDTHFSIMNGSSFVFLSANDTLTFFFQQNTGNSMNVGSSGGDKSIFSIVKLY